LEYIELDYSAPQISRLCERGHGHREFVRFPSMAASAPSASSKTRQASRPTRPARQRSGSRHEILLVAPDHGLLFEVTGLADIFATTNRILEERGREPFYVWKVASTTRERTITGSSGLRVEADVCLHELDPSRQRGTVMVTGRGGRLWPHGLPHVASWLRAASRRVDRIASVCAGTFLLAEAGILRGRNATSHWKCVLELAARYPDTRVASDPIYVRDGKVSTSAGASAGFDLALAFVEEDLGSAIARDVARQLVMYLRRPGGQSQFSVALEREAPSDGPIRKVQAWILDHLDEDLRVERLAEQAAMSPRNFARVFAREIGTTPARHVEELRLESARRHLENSGDTIERIASRCGLGSALELRRVFDRHLGVTPGEYRERFGSI